MKRSPLLAMVILASLTAACQTLSVEEVQNIPIYNDKIYYVIFDEKPDLQVNTITSKGFEIGEVRSRTLTGNNKIAVKILIYEKHDHLMKDTAAFLVEEGRLEYASLGEGGEPLPEGARVLGFQGKTALYWYKMKRKVGAD